MTNVPVHRSTSDVVLAGVCGGIADRLGWNATYLRIGYVLGTFLTGLVLGIVLYVILWLLMPEER